MKRKETAIQKAVENLQTMVEVEDFNTRVRDAIRNIQGALLDSLKSKKELRREALWGLRGDCRQYSAEQAERNKKARKRKK